MASLKHTVYWDSCVFLSWLNEYQDRLDTIQGMWNDITQKREGIIVTSSLAIAEVTRVDKELEHRKRHPDIEKRVKEMWMDPHILIVDASRPIMTAARELMRDVITKGWSLKPNDAIHLATAQFVEKNGRIIQEFNTYDDRLHKYTDVVNIVIQTPHYAPEPTQHSLFDARDE